MRKRLILNKNVKLTYKTKRCSALTDDEIKKVSELFSNNYGTYSKNHPDKEKRGKQIKLGEKYYRDLISQDFSYVALAYHNDELVGQAFYTVLPNNKGNIIWVTQLVVHKKYRRQKIAKKLLFSIWGFSNDQAWGLATTNPITIKALESATMRKIDFKAMKKQIKLIEKIADKISFIKKDSIEITDSNATVNTTFYVDHDDIPSLIKSYGKDWAFTNLDEGFEWLAFTFKNQEPKEFNHSDLNIFFEHSEECLIEAYSRMNMPLHRWTKHTKQEIDFIEQNYITDNNISIIDFGCGQGRHVAEFLQRGYENIIGIDFSRTNIDYAKKHYPKCADHYFVSDCRKYKNRKKADICICLYDVIGSFSDEKENIKIIKSLARNLRHGGKAIISVMNMELTKNIAHKSHIFDVYKNPKKFFTLKASDIMKTTGDVFNPEYFVIDEKSETIFRKEMFREDGMLDAEYIVRDRRYTGKNIKKILESNGFKVKELRYVQSGHWDVPLSPTALKAKEILIVAERNKYPNFLNLFCTKQTP